MRKSTSERSLKKIVKKIELLMSPLQELNNKFKLAFETDTNKFKKVIEELGIDLNSIECIGCNEKIRIEKIRGFYRYSEVCFFFCEKMKCQIKASHKLLEAE